MTLQSTANYLFQKYAQMPSEADKLKKFKAKIAPWLNGSFKILANTAADLSDEIIKDPQHIYNRMDQYSGNIKTSYETIKKNMQSIARNINSENYTPEKLKATLGTITAVIKANPQYQTNPFFLVKKNTEYNFDQCIQAMTNLVDSEIRSDSGVAAKV